MTQSMIYTPSNWSLAELFPAQESSEMQTALQKLENQAAEFEQLRPKLTVQIDPEEFLDIVQQYEELNKLAYRVFNFASLRFTADTQDQAAQTFLAQIEETMARLENRTLFFSLWWKDLDDTNAGRLVRIAGDYTYWLEEMRHFKPHTLTEPEERILNLKNVTGVNAFNTLYDSITNRYSFKISVNGDEKELTRGELMVYTRSHDPDLRAAAYRELYRIYGQDGNILGQIYQTLVRDWRNEQIDLRRFHSPIAARNLRNDIPDQVVETLLAVCQKNAGVFQRFFRLKAHLLGMERLRRYDIYAPITRTEKMYPFGEAVSIVLESFEMFDRRLAGLAQRVFDEDHLDSEVRKGKISGAFCATVTPDLTPWVLVNYQGKPDDVATLAHELGHAIHSMLAAHHTLFTQNSSLPLAETASTFGEMILIDRLLAQEPDPAVRRDMLFRQVDDMYATIQRQAYFALFERQAHELIVGGASVNELADVYFSNLKEQFGDAVEISEEFRWEWVSIPHIYQVPFYVYAYAFGQLLVLSLYQQYKQEGEDFKPRYLKILEAGGAAAPGKVLEEAGVDMYSQDFWQGGFNVIDRLVSELEGMS